MGCTLDSPLRRRRYKFYVGISLAKKGGGNGRGVGSVVLEGEPNYVSKRLTEGTKMGRMFGKKFIVDLIRKIIISLVEDGDGFRHY